MRQGVGRTCRGVGVSYDIQAPVRMACVDKGIDCGIAFFARDILGVLVRADVRKARILPRIVMVDVCVVTDFRCCIRHGVERIVAHAHVDLGIERRGR